MAVLLHLSLLLMEMDLIPSDYSQDNLKFLRVIIQPARIREQSAEAETPVSDSENQREITQPKVNQPVVVAQPYDKSTSSVRIPSVHSQAFENFLQQETQAQIERNQEQLQMFDQSFASPGIRAPAEPTSRRTLVRHLSRTGVGMTEDEKGNRTCYALMHNMLDATAAPAILGKDCTPPRKFELDLEKPNNGWMDR
ncbi:MAG: hypothetical protein AAF431_15130 [Pseudomonadota bacterium]